jgi:hypothetical protein
MLFLPPASLPAGIVIDDNGIADPFAAEAMSDWRHCRSESSQWTTSPSGVIRSLRTITEILNYYAFSVCYLNIMPVLRAL